jgi:TRAP-type uncharacterized transport system substrate-binding protein
MRRILIALSLFVVLVGPSDVGETMITILTSAPSDIHHPLGMTLSTVYDKAATGLPIPLHRGAERYYREIGTLK